MDFIYISDIVNCNNSTEEYKTKSFEFFKGYLHAITLSKNVKDRIKTITSETKIQFIASDEVKSKIKKLIKK